MACFVNVIAVIIFILLEIAGGELEVERYDNIEPVALLRRIYNVAKNPPINYVHLQEPVEIVKEIDAFNTSLVEPKLVDETEMGHSVGAHLPHTATREAALAQVSLHQITQSAHKILDEIKKMNVKKAIENARYDFHKVIFGEDGNESNLCQATVKGMESRTRACGNPGKETKGNSAGKNLVVDFFCLCAQPPDGAGINQVCGFYVGSNRENGQLGWNDTHGHEGFSTMWASIKGGCGKHVQQPPKSTKEGYEVLADFLTHLKSGGVYRWGVNNVEGSNRKAGMLGTGVGKENIAGDNGPVCNGKKGGKGGSSHPCGICVYYGPDNWDDNIPWMKKSKQP